MKIEKVVYNGHVLDEYTIDYTGCVKNIITDTICKSFEVQKRNSIKLYVSLKINQKFINVPLHRILAETFIPNINNYKYVIFKDGNYKNVNVDNLMWSNHISVDYEEKKKKRNVKHVSQRRQKLKNMSVEYKGGHCIICGYNRCMSALEFHHLDQNKKDFSISVNGYTMSWEKVKNELDKCVCVCANCHREIHSGLIDINDYI